MPPKDFHLKDRDAYNKNKGRLYRYVIVSVLVCLAVISYKRASRPTYLAFTVSLPATPRDIATLPDASRTDLIRLIENVNTNNNNNKGAPSSSSWLSSGHVVDVTTRTTKFRNFVLPMNARKINVAPYFSPSTIIEAEQHGLLGELTVVQTPSFNSQLLPLLCELRDGLEKKAKSCATDNDLKAALASNTQYAKQGYAGLVDSAAYVAGAGGSLSASSGLNANPLPTAVIRSRGVGHLRALIGGAAWEQQSSPLLRAYRHPLVSATKLPLWMCTGDEEYWSADEMARNGGHSIDPNDGGKVNTGMKPVTFAVKATLEARRWNKEISTSYLTPLKKLLPTLRVVGAGSGLLNNDGKERSENNNNPAADRATQNGLASEMLLKKVRVWAPLSAPLTEENVQDAALRPSLVCVVLTIRSQLKTAMLQHILWGYQCDEYLVMYTVQDHEEQTYGEDLSFEEERLLNESGIRRDHFVKLHSLPPMAALKTDGYNLAWYRYRQACEWLDYWPEFSRHSYFYFASETVYALPENIYAMLLAPEYRTLHAAGTPLYAGNRMVADVSVSRLNRATPDTLVVPYIHTGAGVLFSATTIRLLAILLENGSCADGALTGSPDVFLAQCLASAGVSARDTADVLGEDRFHPLSPVEMIAASVVSSTFDNVARHGDREENNVIPNGPSILAGGLNNKNHKYNINKNIKNNNNINNNIDDSASALLDGLNGGANNNGWWILSHKPKFSDLKIKENPLRLVSGMSAAFGGMLTAEQLLWIHRIIRG